MNAVVAQPGTRGESCAASSDEQCDWHSIGAFNDLSGKVGQIEVLQCRRCGQGISMPLISDVAFLYEGRQTQDFLQDGSRIGHAIKDVAFRGQAKTLLAQLPTMPERLLDFGCGSGQFTRSFGDLIGPDRVTGSDFDIDPPKDLTGRSYIPARNLAAHNGQFDVVLAMHVLEHDDDPVALLAKITEPASAGGVIVIEVPNVECFWVRVFGKAWDAWYVPYHRTHFSRLALRKLLEENGLQVISEHNICLPTMGRSLSNLFDGQKGLFWLLVGIIAHPVQWLGEKISDKPSALRFILRKEPC
jgi:SAM-dependent methyltransferase